MTNRVIHTLHYSVSAFKERGNVRFVERTLCPSELYTSFTVHYENFAFPPTTEANVRRVETEQGHLRFLQALCLSSECSLLHSNPCLCALCYGKCIQWNDI